jgi:hypothetical protein
MKDNFSDRIFWLEMRSFLTIVEKWLSNRQYRAEEFHDEDKTVRVVRAIFSATFRPGATIRRLGYR